MLGLYIFKLYVDIILVNMMFNSWKPSRTSPIWFILGENIQRRSVDDGNKHLEFACSHFGLRKNLVMKFQHLQVEVGTKILFIAFEGLNAVES